MTLGELFSKQVSDYITDVNKKYPDISSAEFCKMVEGFVEKNKGRIIVYGTNKTQKSFC